MYQLKTILLLSCILSLTACTQKSTAQGKIGTEQFIGVVEFSITANGSIKFETTSGTTCMGKFKHDEGSLDGLSYTGTGTLVCNDETTATFKIVSDNFKGIGFGKTNKKEPIKFSFDQDTKKLNSDK